MIQAGNIVSVHWSTTKDIDWYRVERAPEGRGYWDLVSEDDVSFAIPVTGPTLIGIRKEAHVCSFCFQEIKAMRIYPWDDNGEIDAIKVSTAGVRWGQLGVEWEDTGDAPREGVAHQDCLDAYRQGLQ